MTNKFKKIFLVFSIFLFLFLPLLVLALTFKPQVIPGGAKEFGADPGGTIFYYFGEIYKWAVPAIGVIAVIMIMIAGFQWMLAGGNATKVSAAKTRMTNSVVGLILVIGAYSIFNFINPALVKAPRLAIKTVETKEIKKYPDPAEMVKARDKVVTKKCEQTSDCQGTPEEPVYDLFCLAGVCTIRSMPGGTQCMGYGGTCEKDAFDIKDTKPLGCCDERLKCIKIAGEGGGLIPDWMIKDVNTCLPPQ